MSNFQREIATTRRRRRRRTTTTTRKITRRRRTTTTATTNHFLNFQEYFGSCFFLFFCGGYFQLDRKLGMFLSESGPTSRSTANWWTTQMKPTKWYCSQWVSPSWFLTHSGFVDLSGKNAHTEMEGEILRIVLNTFCDILLSKVQPISLGVKIPPNTAGLEL